MKVQFVENGRDNMKECFDKENNRPTWDRIPNSPPILEQGENTILPFEAQRTVAIVHRNQEFNE